MSELSIFCDESGGMDGHSKYRIITLVFHDQSNDIQDVVSRYESNLLHKGLPDIPFHASPLMNRHEQYEDMDMSARRKLFAAFSFFQRKLPYTYKSFIYRRSDYPEEDTFLARFKRDLVVFLADNLSFFQAYDSLKIYYDGGQQTITDALHGALEYEISKQAIVYRNASPREYRLGQVADYICAIELIAIKFNHREITSTDEKFFGKSASIFKRDYLKKIRVKSLD